MGSVLLTAKTPSARRNSYNCYQQPSAPSRRHSLNVPPLTLKSVTQIGGMDSGRYHRPASPRGRMLAPGRSSTGTFADPYSHDSYYGRDRTSPRTSAERIGGSQYPAYTSSTSSYTPSASTGSRSSGLKYDSYSGRPRRSTVTEEDRPTAAKPLPIRAPGVHSQHHHHLDTPSSPLARSWDNRGDTYITHGPSQHKRIYSVDDKSHSTKLVAEKELVKADRKDSREPQGYSVTSGGRPYHTSSSSRHSKTADLGDDGYSYTDAAGMYRDTEPAWRRPRAGSLERSARPTSLIMERAPRTSARELGPPPSTRGFDKINNGIPRTSSVREPPRSSSTDIAREIPKYDAYSDAPVHRSSSTRHTPAVHQEPREHRRDTYDPYETRDRDYENRRQSTADSFQDREVTARGFGILPGNPSIAHEQHPLDRQPIWSPQETARGRVVDDYGAAPYYAPERADARMPDLPRAEPPRPEPPRVEPPRVPRERERERDRDRVPTYEERPRERDRRDRDSEDRGLKSVAIPAVAGVAAGAAAVTYGAGDILKARERERERERDRDLERDRERDRDPDRERERDRERRREHDERDRRDRAPEERRERAPEERREIAPEERRDRGPEARLPPAAAAYASIQEPERRPRERRYEDDERERKPRRAPSSDGSNDERPRHYVDREVAREADRRKEQSSKEAPLDPDEEYRQRIQLEAERSGRAAREREPSDSDKERERRRRKEDRDRSRDAPDRARGPPSSIVEPPQTRYDDPRRSAPLLNTNVVSEPDSFTSPAVGRDGPSKSVQIVEAPREPPSAPKGILRKPTEKFPEHPESIREGVAPHKDAMKGKDIPVNARWTKIDRSLVNPEALEEAKERYEERMDCVIVLRVLTKQDIQKLADKTKEIRQAREEDFEHKERRDRDRRSHRSHRDDEDRDHRRDYDDSEDDDIGGRDREPDWYRQRHREEPLSLEAAR
ncbi:hypothetical protein BDV96DRAFT_600808 [Lophiotrema nucula]|uniref:DUF8035 domain-containing protein n=1 Tax=Lophiotrema nucula TaxID=690887 RepID=A0A6A5Z3S6_9PLEO|nr:hypothetical protein BDV96DRAFT_600808 [Lophiotrema nucula]